MLNNKASVVHKSSLVLLAMRGGGKRLLRPKQLFASSPPPQKVPLIVRPVSFRMGNTRLAGEISFRKNILRKSKFGKILFRVQLG